MKKVLFYFKNKFMKFSGEKFIINTDPGADDAVAILMFLRYESTKPATEFKIIGITCTFGNIEEKQAEINLLNILTFAGRTDVSIVYY